MGSPSISISSGIGWAGIAQFGKIVLQLVGIFTLARLLPPRDYGLMAMAATVTAFATLFRDFGTGAALIQCKEITPALKYSVFLFNLFLGLVLSTSLVLFSPVFSEFFNEPRLRSVLIALSPVFIFTALGVVQQATLERNSLFRKIAIIEISSGTIALVLSLLVAFHGGGVYALVTQSVIGSCVSSIFLWIWSDWRPKIKLQKISMNEIWKFSSNIFIFNFLNYFHRNADSFLIGRFLGPSDLGIYNIAYRILLFPLQAFTFVVARASFPIYSRNQDDLEGIGMHYLEILKNIAFLTAPLMALLWVVREPFLRVFLGEQWLPAADVMAWLVPVGFFQSLVSTSGSVLNAIGRSDLLRNLGFIGVPFLVLSIVIGLQWGIVGVSMAYCIANFFWVYPVVKTVLEKFSLSFWLFLLSIYKPVFLALILAILSNVFFDFGNLNEFSAIVQLALMSFAFLFSFVLLSRPFWPEFLTCFLSRLLSHPVAK